MTLKERFKRIKWDEGASELLSFCLMCPFALYFILFFLDVAVYVRAGQIAEYCAYIGGRAAVVTTQQISTATEDRISAANNSANSVVAETMNANDYGMAADGKIQKPREWTGAVSLVKADGEWVKGALMEYSITISIPTFTDNPTTPRIVTSGITMMIETPAISGEVGRE